MGPYVGFCTTAMRVEDFEDVSLRAVGVEPVAGMAAVTSGLPPAVELRRWPQAPAARTSTHRTADNQGLFCMRFSPGACPNGAGCSTGSKGAGRMEACLHPSCLPAFTGLHAGALLHRIAGRREHVPYAADALPGHIA